MQARNPTHRHRIHVRGTGILREILPYYRWGVAAGVLGAFVVAVFFLALDLSSGRPLATPNALGSSLFLGEPFDLARPLSPIVILGYSAVHGGLFIGLALVVSALVLGSRSKPAPIGMLALILTGSFFAGLTLLFASFSSLSATLAGGLRTPLVLAANLLAAMAMGLLLAVVFQSRWHPETPLVPRLRPRAIRERRRSHAGSPQLRDPAERANRLDPEWFHLFSLTQSVEKLRAEPEYDANGHNGIVLQKTERQSIVLEVAREGGKIAEHTVLGSAAVVVLDGSLEVVCGGESRAAHAGEMVLIPHDRPRSMHATSDTSFLWMLAIDPPDEEADARAFVPNGPPKAFGPSGR